MRPHGEHPDCDTPLFALEVSVFLSDTWTSVYRRDLALGRPEDGRGPEDYSAAERIVMDSPQPVEVRIWPSPTGRHALVEVSGQNDDPGMGFWPDALAWITLPADLPRVQPSDDEVSYAVPAFSATDARPAAARRVNRAGLEAHGRDDFATSARFFAMATLTDPSNPMPRYNLARQGRLDLALFLLNEIAASGCPQCAERMERARVDPDLAPLASRLPR